MILIILKVLIFKKRAATELDFFSDIINYAADNSNPVFIEPKEINKQNLINEIIKFNPDLIITYGCSIINPPLIDYFPRKIINVHLGLSPYYFGSK